MTIFALEQCVENGVDLNICDAESALAEIDTLRTQLAEAQDALQAAQRLFKEALQKFNWGASFLDANAIQLLNEVTAKVNAAIGAAKVSNES